MATSAILSPTVFDFSGSFSTSTTQTTTMSAKPKPKLSLNITSSSTARSFGRNSTALRLDAIGADSPTSRNTYTNAHDPSAVAAVAVTPTASSANSSIREHTTQAQPPSKRARIPLNLSLTTCATPPLPSSPSSRPSSKNCHSGLDSPLSRSQQPPYTLPSTIRSILLNGPIPRSKRSRAPPTPLPDTISLPSAGIVSPMPKKVCFREPVSEEIHNESYLLAHSDSRSRSSSPGPGSSARDVAVAATEELAPCTKGFAPSSLGRMAAEEDEEAQDQADEGDSFAAKTPVAGRHKKQREWTWTLGPLPGLAASQHQDVEGKLADAEAEAEVVAEGSTMNLGNSGGHAATLG